MPAHQPPPSAAWRRRTRGSPRRRSRRQVAEAALGGVERVLTDVARDHQHGVGGTVVVALERAQLLRAGRRQLGWRPQHGAPVGMVAVEQRLDAPLERVPRIALVHGELFEDDAALVVHFGRLEQQSAHAVRLDVERLLPAVGRELEVVGGRVVAGERVVVAAQALRQTCRPRPLRSRPIP